MKSTTRLGLVAVVVVALSLLTARTAFAGKLWPPGSDSTASGSASTKYDGPYYDMDGGPTFWVAHTKWSVRGLAPWTWYNFVVADHAVSYSFTFQTDDRGQAAGTYGWESYAPPAYAYLVYDATLTTVVLRN